MPATDNPISAQQGEEESALEAADSELSEIATAETPPPESPVEDLPEWAREIGLTARQFEMTSFREALRKYPEFKNAVDLVQKTFDATPREFNGRPIL